MSFSRIYHHTLIIGLLFALLAMHGLGLHHDGHVPHQNDIYADHARKAEFHLASFLTEYGANDTDHDDGTWTEVDLGGSAIAKKSVDSVIFAIFSLVILLILKRMSQTTCSTLFKHCNNARPQKLLRITPQLRAPPQ